MLNENLFLLSFDELKNILAHDLTIFDCALTYVLVYVVYKSLGRYIYFKPEEHASKINRTLLAISLLIVLIHFLRDVAGYLPFLPEYVWLYAVCGLILLMAPISMVMGKLIWERESEEYRNRRNWAHRYLPVPTDYFRVPVSQSKKEGSYSTSWEVEGVESTNRNLPSDMLLNLLALTVFLTTGVSWAGESMAVYGWYSLAFFVIIACWITAIFLDRGVFSWIAYCEDKKPWKNYYKRKSAP
jgi:hypothetical protein